MHAHIGQPVLHSGEEAGNARAALIMLHGRGASAQSILGLAESLDTEGLTLRAPQAEGSVWYPQSFLAPREANQAGIDGAFTVIRSLVDELGAAGIPKERIMLLGFSQGACLATDFLYHHPEPYGAIFALSGGLIGPPGTTWEDRSGLTGTRAFVGCSDTDPFIPVERVRETHETLQRAGAESTLRLYPGMPHTVNEDELSHINEMISAVRG